ncbi:MAG: type I phosphomannose isomerase catalytic subunit [Acidimicrobiia bacterium]
MTTPLQPFTLAPVLVDRPWGGTRLARYGKDIGGSDRVAESWELADLPAHVVPAVDDPNTRIASGRHCGLSLRELIALNGDALLGPIPPTSEGRFPLLVKLLDARENLSVQVHPPAAYVADHPEARLKTESWYVVEAEPGSALFLDVEPGVTLEEIADRMGSGAIVPLLRRVDAVAGDFWHLPAGLVHALGAGTIVAEVQTPSDTTYRMYDWSREYARQPRELHADASLESIRLDLPEHHVNAGRSPKTARTLIDNDHYRIVEHQTEGGEPVVGSTPGPAVLLVISGTVRLGDLTLTAGSTAVVPHECGEVSLRAEGEATILEVSLALDEHERLG